MERKHQIDPLRYCLRDYLEVNYSQDPLLISKLVQELVRSFRRPRKLTPLSCVALGDTLVVIQNGHEGQLRKLRLLDARKSLNRTFVL